MSVALELADPIVVLDLEMKITTIEEGQDTFQTLLPATQIEGTYHLIHISLRQSPYKLYLYDFHLSHSLVG